MSAKLLSSILACATLLLAPLQSEAQLPRDPVERARVISQIMETQSRQLTLFDRQGQTIGVVGPRDLYNQPVFSPDAKRMAVIKPDLDKETNDLWVIDVASAKGIQITSSQPARGRELTGMVARRKPGRVCRAARRATSVSIEKRQTARARKNFSTRTPRR